MGPGNSLLNPRSYESYKVQKDEHQHRRPAKTRKGGFSAHLQLFPDNFVWTSAKKEEFVLL
jgi:hypothetical protein